MIFAARHSPTHFRTDAFDPDVVPGEEMFSGGDIHWFKFSHAFIVFVSKRSMFFVTFLQTR